MNLIEKYEKMNLKEIEDFIKNQQEENLFLEFKTVSDYNLDREDKKNLAKALSGFANSSGGLIIWGVDARKNDDGVDCAKAKSEIKDLSLFISRLNQLTGEMVNPIVEGVEHKKIEISSNLGFGITLVPPSDSGPHMAKGGEDRYYKRSGDSFYRMEHFDIEDMFGRRKKPDLKLKYRTIYSPTNSFRKIKVVIGIENNGRGPAKSPFLAICPTSPFRESQYGLDESGNFGLPRLVKASGSNEYKYGASSNIVIHPGTVCDVTVFESDSLSDFVIDYKIGAEEVKLVEGEIKITLDQIKTAK